MSLPVICTIKVGSRYLYAYFLHPQRWEILQKHLSITLRQSCDTRWEAKIDSVKAVFEQTRNNVEEFINVNDYTAVSETKNLLDSIQEMPIILFESLRIHFSDDAIRRYTEAYNEKTGEKMCVPLKRFRLQNFAGPTIFTDFPTYLSNSGNPTRECPEQRLQRLENEHLNAQSKQALFSRKNSKKGNNLRCFQN
ncbi:hypothetical protein TNCV_618151 [Trichonephila clavipes]|nr:hypothetical protein TNCV_618151 [Trichonephila clavipes]